MHSYCRRKGSKFRKLSPIPNTIYLLQTYGVMSSAPWFLPLESGCSHLSMVGEENFNGR